MRFASSSLSARRREWLGSSQGLVVLAFAVGVGAGLGAIAFRYLILGLTEVFSGHRDYSAAGHVANPHVPGSGSGSSCSRRWSAA